MHSLVFSCSVIFFFLCLIQSKEETGTTDTSVPRDNKSLAMVKLPPGYLRAGLGLGGGRKPITDGEEEESSVPEEEDGDAVVAM